MKQARLALITGATGGLGRALAAALAKRSIPLYLTATNEEALAELARELRAMTQVDYSAINLSSTPSRQHLLEMIQEKAPDLVFNNAGFGFYGECLAHPTRAHTELLTVNSIAVMEITLESARALIKKKEKGTILNISSAAAFFSFPLFATYAASKGFVNQFSSAFDREVAPQGVRVLTVCPGQIDTPFCERASKGRCSNKVKKGPSFSAEQAAEEILAYAERGGRSVRVINGVYRLILPLRHLFPRSWLAKSLARSIRTRL
jgi:short-subunit dehydrogenase